MATTTEKRILQGIKVNITMPDNEKVLSDEEIWAYIDRFHHQNPMKKLSSIDISVDGDNVDLSYQVKPQEFERIRRITGYLVGTMDRWNDAKSAEERDRVKHGVRDIKELDNKLDNLSNNASEKPIKRNDNPSYDISPIDEKDYQNLEQGAGRADYSSVTKNKNGETVGLSSDEAKFLKEKYGNNQKYDPAKGAVRVSQFKDASIVSVGEEAR